MLKNRQDTRPFRNLVLACLDFKLLVNKEFAPPGVVTARKQNIFAVQNIFVFVCVFVKDFAAGERCGNSLLARHVFRR